MGSCACSGNAGELDDNFIFPTEVTLKIKESGVASNRTRKAKFSVTSPKFAEYKPLVLKRSTLGVSMCILPGQDPCKEVHKACQDGLFVTDSNGSVFAALFDGHGTRGEEVVEFCINYLQKYFKEHRSSFDNDPATSIKVAIESCNEALDHVDTIDSNLAGTTAVVIYLNTAGIHVGSVGDSRCILGTSTDPDQRSEGSFTKPKTSTNFNNFKRKLEEITTISAIPLSTDQKPNHEGEMDRILQAGGKVARLMDENGNRVGPYRVWNAMGHVPGLAMSRSLGDRVAHSVGVSATPIVETFSFDPNDKFIVIASDGVWDVMENKDVGNLVEKFRRKCKKTNYKSIPRKAKAVDLQIAHLLALEARYRWFDVVQEEDVMIDDISVIVIELEDLPQSALMPSPSPPSRKSIFKQSMAIQDEHKQVVTAVSGASSPKHRDPIRSSTAGTGALRISVSRNDKVRGSIVLNEDERAMTQESPEAIRNYGR
mmetsp:Transcript_29371/g.52582  ORF Transcript_29371/g.52582 Transcript_29371/m.52582 type:complete len:484 (-) Transcript_29371:32-1483(-)